MTFKKLVTRKNVKSTLLIILIIGSCIYTDIITAENKLTLTILLSGIISTLTTYFGIPVLHNLKVKQIIRIEGPEAHHKKSGTPTMGGALFIPIGISIGLLINYNLENEQTLNGLILLVIGFFLIGAIDDWLSISSNKNTGLYPKDKLFLQLILGVIYLIWSISKGWISSTITFPQEISINLGLLIFPLALFVVIAQSNATNLTDGLDGLASGCSALVFTGLAIQIVLRENNNDLAIAYFSLAMAGSCIGFLIFNQNPAKIFMGDTGSLAIGAALSGIALNTDSLWALLIMGGVFLAESLSVIIQVSVFKISKNIYGQGLRVFKMTPLHHHFELEGGKEEAIVNYFWLTTIGLIFCYLILMRTT